MSEEGAEMTRRRRRGASPAAPASLPDDDDLLREILLRLPPQPSSLPRASSVCRRWRRLATDPQFLRRFRAHHRTPPLLGVFERRDKIVFTPILDSPDRIPPERFVLPSDYDDYGYGTTDVLGCRHGRVIVKDRVRQEIIVCDPITGEELRRDVPPEFKWKFVNGEVLCAAGDQDHVHGGCHSSPFKVVVVSMFRSDSRPIVCVYSSETGLWGDLISTAAPCLLHDAGKPGTLVGNALYWLCSVCSGDDVMLEFDLDRQSLAVIRGPSVTDYFRRGDCWIIQAEDGAVGFAILSYPSLQMWQRKVNCHGVATWLLWKTVEMHNILGLPPQFEGPSRGMQTIMGYDEDTDVIFLYVNSDVYMVQLKSMQSRRLYETNYMINCYPFTSFYTPGTTIAGGYDGAEILHGT